MKNGTMIRKEENPFDLLAKRFFGDDFLFKPSLTNNYGMGKTNIIDNENEYIVQLSVPGFKKDDINIELNDDVLTISSKMEDKKEEKTENYFRQEFAKSSFERSFSIPIDVDVNKIDAKMEDGILNVKVPKKIENKKDNKLSIKIK